MSDFKFVWEFISCILAKVATFLLQSKDFYWYLLKGFIWSLSFGGFGVAWVASSQSLYYMSFYCLHSIVSPLLLLDINFKLNVTCCKLGLNIKYVACYHVMYPIMTKKSLSWSCGLKDINFMLNVAFWQHENYHIPYDSLHVMPYVNF